MHERHSRSELAAAGPRPIELPAEELTTGELRTGELTTGQQPATNRAARRGHGTGGRPAAGEAGGAGKVKPVRFDHATDPRQYAAHRRG